jgi:uncharacterized membrane protein YqjE
MQQGDGNKSARTTLAGMKALGAPRTPELEIATIGELFKQLSNDATDLMRSEVALAKSELTESVATAAGATAKIGVAVVFALAGLLAIMTALIIGLGIVMGSYWASALIVGVVILAIAAVAVRRAAAVLKKGLVPTATTRTIRDDVAWARDEATRVKRELSA